MSTDFVGQEAGERRKQEIEAVVKTIRELTILLSDLQVFQQSEFLTELIPAIILDQIDTWGYGDLYEDLNKVVLATQALAMEHAQWRKAKNIPGFGMPLERPVL